jgi:hypothetical protein
MSRIVASRVWTCEFCKVTSYDLEAIKKHLEEVHRILVYHGDANGGLGGDNYIVSSDVIPRNLDNLKDQDFESITWYRADGRTLCPVCGIEYVHHPELVSVPFLKRICNGLLVKT